MSNINSVESPGTTILASAPDFAGIKWTFGSLTKLYNHFPNCSESERKGCLFFLTL